MRACLPLVSWFLVQSQALRGSGGCGRALPSKFRDELGSKVKLLINVTDPDPRLTMHKQRTFRVIVPPSYNVTAPLPALLYYHGQCDDPLCSDCKWEEVTKEHDFIMIMPVGLNDGTGCVNWDVGSSGRSDVCTKQCRGTTSSSCKITNNSSNCNWSTCYDDFYFAKVLMEQVLAELCIDQDQIFLSGASNGAMFGYQLASRLPIFAGFVPWYGAYLVNMELAPPPSATRSITLFAMHGLVDTTIPWSGGQSYDHYLYISGNQTQQDWRSAEGCTSVDLEELITPWNNGTNNDDDEDSMRFQCERFKCEKMHRSFGSGASYHPPAVVGRCLWPAQDHGFDPAYWERMTWWALTGQVGKIVF